MRPQDKIPTPRALAYKALLEEIGIDELLRQAMNNGNDVVKLRQEFSDCADVSSKVILPRG